MKNRKGSGTSPQLRDYSAMLRPLLTEKTAGLGNVPVFEVDARLGKCEIRQAIERVFGVKVEKVNTAKIQGKPKKGARGAGRRRHIKKAYVLLAPGERIDVVEGV